MLRSSLTLFPTVSRFNVNCIRSVHRVALVGSGPSSFYSAKYLLEQHPDVLVDMYEKLPVPFGLVRFGVAPDHPEVKSVSTTFNEVAQSPRFRYFGNVTIGVNNRPENISLQALMKAYSGVVLAYGATSDNSLSVPNETMKGIYSARHFVNWYNGHPHYCESGTKLFNLKGVSDVVIIGQGNVALDCARILTRDLEELAVTDITQESLDILAHSDVQTVTLIGRRGHVQAAFTIKEFRELTRLKGVQVKIADADITAGLTEASKLEFKDTRPKKRIVELIEATAKDSKPTREEGNKVIDFRFLLSPTEFIGTQDSTGQMRVSSMLAVRNKLTGEANKQRADPTKDFVEIPCQLVLKSVGYKGEPICEELPFDKSRNVVPSVQGRVRSTSPRDKEHFEIDGQNESDSVVKGLYVAGWIKRGPTGIIGTNIPDAKDTVLSVLTDIKNSKLKECNADPREVLFKGDGLKDVVGWSGYQKIDEQEVARGQQKTPPKEREKLLMKSEMLEIAHQVATRH